MTKLYIYENNLGQYILVTGPLATDEYAFETREEAQIVAAKLETARAILQVVQSLASATDSAGDRWQEYFDVTAAHGAYTDEDLAALGIDAATLISCVTLLEQFNNFMNNEVVTQDAYRVTLNKVRRV